MASLEAGTSLSHYNILRQIGVGGMGEVYLAEDTLLHRNVAVKFLPAEATADERAARRLVREARAAAALDHPNICTVHEVGEADGRTFIVMQYVEGEDLSTRLRRRRLDLDEALVISIQIAEALAEAHSRGIIHRDVKPQNIMLTGRSRVKILDFGLAKILSDGILDRQAETQSLLTGPGMVVGTLHYMSPEQVRCEPIDQRTDIFSFGVVMYEMVTGRRLFEGHSSADVITAILTSEPPSLADHSDLSGLEHFLKRCLEKSKDRRYRSMAEVTAELEKIRSECSNELKPRSGKDKSAATLRLPIEPNNDQRPLLMTLWRYLAPSVILILAALGIGYAFFFRTPPSVPTAGVRRVDPAAYDLYMRAKVKAGSDNRQQVESAIKLLEQAVAIDPDYAEAYAILAQAYNTKAFQFASDTEKNQLNEDAEVAVEKALALNPDLAEGHFARGVILWTHAKRFPHEQAIQAFKRALELNPNLDEAHHRLAMVYSHIGLLDEARKEIKKAIEINPNNTMARFRAGTFERYSGNYAEAIAIFKTVPADFSEALIGRNVADALFSLGRFDEASAVVEDYLKRFPEDEGGNVTSVKAMLLAREGRQKETEETIARAIEVGQGFGHFHHTAYNIASAYAMLNKPDEAVKWLQDAADDGFPCYRFFEIDHNLDNIRNSPQFTAFMARLKPQWERYKAAYSTN